MPMILIVIVLFLALLAMSLKAAFKSGDKQSTTFYRACYGLSLELLALHSVGVYAPGPSDLIMKLAESLALIQP